MKVLIIDPDASRGALVAEGLADVQPLEMRRVTSFHDIERELASWEPEAVVVACGRADRDTFDTLRDALGALPRPVVMFVDRSAPGLAEAAVAAGLAAYVVDGLSPGRVRPVLEVAVSRFELMHKLKGDLAKAKADLASRKAVERAKGLLMKERGIDEEAAYKVLRKLAMDTGRPISAVANDLLTFAGVLKGRDQ
jgi:two-component system, response regulator / RNA-binding antiterminator